MISPMLIIWLGLYGKIINTNMIIRFVYKVFPVPVFYVDSLPNGYSGFFQAIIIPIVKIKKGCEEDIGLLEHELEHCRQYIRLPVVHSLLYKLVPRYRYWAELQAYRHQLDFSDDRERSANHFAKFLAKNYDLDISVEKAKEDLLK